MGGGVFIGVCLGVWSLKSFRWWVGVSQIIASALVLLRHELRPVLENSLGQWPGPGPKLDNKFKTDYHIYNLSTVRKHIQHFLVSRWVTRPFNVETNLFRVKNDTIWKLIKKLLYLWIVLWFQMFNAFLIAIITSDAHDPLITEFHFSSDHMFYVVSLIIWLKSQSML